MKSIFAFLTKYVSITYASLVLVSLAGAPFAQAAVTLPPYVEALHKGMTQDGCNANSGEIEMYKVSDKVNLYIVPCYAGAYQMTGNVYLDKPAEKSAEAVQVLSYSELVKGVVGDFNLGNPSYDPVSKMLYSQYKGRGLGDCGQYSRTQVIVNDYGVGVKTVEIRHKAKCDGKYNDWPVVFRQK